VRKLNHSIILAGMCIFVLTAHSKPTKRIQITFDGYKGTEVLTNFPILVSLGTHLDGFSYNDFESATGDDLRFTAEDGTTTIYHEIEKWDTGGTSVVWVQIPAFTNNTTIWAYWADGWSGSVPPYSTNGSVWSQDYVGVYHLSENGSATTYADSSAEGNDLASSAAPAETSGIAGSARYFAPGSTTEPLVVNSLSGGLAFDDMTVTIWSKSTNAVGWGQVWAVKDASDNDLYLALNDDTPANAVLFNSGLTGASNINDTDDPAEGTDWKFLVLTVSTNDNNASIYVNGVMDGSPKTWSASAVAAGFKLDASWHSDSALGGTLDEARFSKTVRSTDWIRACYQYQGPNSDDHAQYSSVADTNVAAPTIVNGAATDTDLSFVTIQGSLTAGTWAEVTLRYGESDGAAGGWEYTNVVSGLYTTNGNISVKLTGLKANTQYYYAFYAANSAGTSLAQPSGNFSTEPVKLWSWKSEISLDGYSGSSTLTNFPVLIKLGSNIPNFDYADVEAADGSDLRFTDADRSVVLPYEIEVWDTNATSYIWVRVPILTSSTKILAFWGNSGATVSPSYTTDGSVWSEGYVGVYHFAETGSPAIYDDSSPYDNDIWGSMNSSEAAGNIGGARSFSQNNEFKPLRIVSPQGGMNVSEMTMSLWAITPYGSADWKPWCGIDVAPEDDNIRLAMDDTDPGNAALNYDNIADAHGVYDADDDIEDGNWHQIAVTASTSADRARLIVDGVQDGSWKFWAASEVVTGLKVGASWGIYANRISVGATIDEARFSKVARSEDWMKAANDTQADNAAFTTYGITTYNKPIGTVILIQ